MNRPGCYDPSIAFKPQWAQKTPEGFRDEPFALPFTFTVAATGVATLNLPWQLDDDVQWIMREIIFSGVGTRNGSQGAALIRIRDSRGNPLCDDLVLALGEWCQSGFINGFGFPVEPEVEMEVGGSVIFDFQFSSNGFVALATFIGVAETIFFATRIFGAAGNALGLTIQLIDPGAPNIPLSVAIVGGIHVQVTLQTNGAAAIITTAQQVADIINNTPAVFALMGALVFGTNPAEVVTAMAATPLAGGVNGGNVTIDGTLIGVKRFKECL